MIERLQHGAVDAVRVMEEARSRAQDSSDQVEKAAESLAHIAGAVSGINDMNAQIASAAEEQSAVSAEISNAIASIREVSDQVAAGAQQTASASEELARLSATQQALMARFRM
jgi:methyl-accepting chemotaxis protein